MVTKKYISKIFLFNSIFSTTVSNTHVNKEATGTITIGKYVLQTIPETPIIIALWSKIKP